MKSEVDTFSHHSTHHYILFFPGSAPKTIIPHLSFAVLLMISYKSLFSTSKLLVLVLLVFLLVVEIYSNHVIFFLTKLFKRNMEEVRKVYGKIFVARKHKE